MCGIVGFSGTKQAVPILLIGLSKLEYRGYDSAGIAVRDGEKPTGIIKEKGKLKLLADMTNQGKSVKGTCGIGHTRWATHGEPSAVNALLHRSDYGNVIAIHNGIIDNFQDQRDIPQIEPLLAGSLSVVSLQLISYYVSIGKVFDVDKPRNLAKSVMVE